MGSHIKNVEIINSMTNYILIMVKGINIYKASITSLKLYPKKLNIHIYFQIVYELFTVPFRDKENPSFKTKKVHFINSHRHTCQFGHLSSENLFPMAPCVWLDNKFHPPPHGMSSVWINALQIKPNSILPIFLLTIK